jgi:predicted  nucleic acid-binding Zn-ribbon protein
MRSLVLVLPVLLTLGCDLTGEKLDALAERVETLEQEMADAKTAAKHTAALEEKVETLEKKTSTNETDLVAANKRAELDQKTIQSLRLEIDELKIELGKVVEFQEKTTEGGEEVELGKIGIEACDDYIEKYRKCVMDKMPEAARESTMRALEQSVEAWKAAAEGPARDSLADTCKEALKIAGKALKSMGCEF